MSTDAHPHFEQGVTETDGERRVAPPVLELTDEQAAADPLAEITGTITVVYGRADAPVIEAVDRSLGADDPSFGEWLAEEFPRHADDAATDPSDPAVSAELTYEGRPVADLSLGDDDAFGVAIESFNGGELDETGFKVEESGDADLEYRVLVVPPAVDDNERAAGREIPTGLEDAAILTEPDQTEICGTWAAAAFGAMLGVAYANSGNSSNLEWRQVADADALDADHDYEASVEELLEA